MEPTSSRRRCDRPRQKEYAIQVRFTTFVLAILAYIVGAQAAEPYAQMWKGQELWKFGGGKFSGSAKDWHGMAGATLGLNYSGKGPLPGPIEFVIPLEKPLPLGAYRLFVKNF